jgi:hypothetical protein
MCTFDWTNSRSRIHSSAITSIWSHTNRCLYPYRERDSGTLLPYDCCAVCVCAAAEGVHCTRARIVLIVTWECVRARNQPSQYCVVITKNNNHASRRPIDMASDQLLVDVSPSTANGVTAASTTATNKSNVHVTGACVLVV